MNLIKFQDLEDRAVYEFCYGENFQHWKEDSLYLPWKDFLRLSSYLDAVFSNYHYYGPQKVMLHDWEKVKNVFFSSPNHDEAIAKFFVQIDDWLEKRPTGQDYFWILGV